MRLGPGLATSPTVRDILIAVRYSGRVTQRLFCEEARSSATEQARTVTEDDSMQIAKRMWLRSMWLVLFAVAADVVMAIYIRHRTPHAPL
jgi:hypothetical protein